MRRFWEMVDSESALSQPQTGWLVAVASGVAAPSATWLAHSMMAVNLPFLFCIAAVTANAVRRGIVAGLVAAVLSLTGTILIAEPDNSLVNPRSVALVSLFCIIVSVGGESMKRLRRREQHSAIDARRRERILQVIFDGSPAVMLIIDLASDIVDANEAACSLFEQSRDAFMGERLEHLVPTHAIKTNALHTIILPSGKILRLDIRNTSLLIGTDSFRMVYIRDETKAVLSTERLAMAQRELYQISRATALGQLGSSIAHELNQPLTIIANYAGVARAVLAAEKPDLVAARGAIEDTLAHAFRAATMLKRLRNFVGRKLPILLQVDVRTLLEEAAKLGALATKGVRAELQIDLSHADFEVSADAIQLQQVILNLVINAADALRGYDDRRIRLQACRDATGDAVFAVEDSGPGLPPKLRHDVFAPFQSTKTDGVGIGLALCRTIIEAHGGRIWCDDDTELGGARFLFTLPHTAIGGKTDATRTPHLHHR
jgi:two-component system sensor kinase FixL